MNVKEYISSGIIESYVLGLATPEEVVELERLCAQYPEIQQALLEAEDTMGAFALMQKEEPPVSSKHNILSRLEEEGLINTTLEAETENSSRPLQTTTLTSGNNRTQRAPLFIAAACLLLLLAGTVYHIITVNELKEQILALTAQQKTLLAQNTSYKDQLLSKQKDLSLLAKPTVFKYNMQGVTGHEGASASLYWDHVTKDLYLIPENLPALSTDKQYQLWAIVDGKPVSAGVYSQENLSDLQKMLRVEKAEMFAITIEKAGGVEQPTLSQMIVASKI